MADTTTSRAEARLTDLGVGGVFLRMARDGQILDVVCEMPHCYCPKGRKYFAKKTESERKWELSFDHYPRLKTDGGTKTPGNARLGHIWCNNEDYHRRLTIRDRLNRGQSLEEIADHLNRKRVGPPHGEGKWTAARVRKVQVT